jgi:hypothetical protein
LPHHVNVSSLTQTVLPVAAAGGKLLLAIVILGMVAATFGAALESTLASGYTLAQFFGWTWGKFRKPKEAARFHLTMIICLIIGMAVLLTGVDPVQVTEIAVVFSAIALPLTYLPILIVANDPSYMGKRVNGRVLNGLAMVYLVIVIDDEANIDDMPDPAPGVGEHDAVEKVAEDHRLPPGILEMMRSRTHRSTQETSIESRLTLSSIVTAIFAIAVHGMRYQRSDGGRPPNTRVARMGPQSRLVIVGAASFPVRCCRNGTSVSSRSATVATGLCSSSRICRSRMCRCASKTSFDVLMRQLP